MLDGPGVAALSAYPARKLEKGVWMGVEAVVAVAGAFIGGVAVLGAAWRMIAHYDKTNRKSMPL